MKNQKKRSNKFAIGDDALYRLLERVSTCSILDGTSETRSRSKLTAIIASNVRPPCTRSPSIDLSLKSRSRIILIFKNIYVSLYIYIREKYCVTYEKFHVPEQVFPLYPQKLVQPASA